MDTVKGKFEMSVAIDLWISFVQVLQEKQCSQKTPRLNVIVLVLKPSHLVTIDLSQIITLM